MIQVHYFKNIEILTAWLSRITTALISILVIRIYIENYGVEQSAIFIVLNSLMIWYGIFEMGISSSLQNYMSIQKSSYIINKIINAGIQIIIILSLLAATFYFLFAEIFVGEILKNYNVKDEYQKKLLFIVIGSLSSITALSNILYKILLFKKKSYLYNLGTVVGSVAGIFLMLWYNNVADEKNIVFSTLFYIAPPIILQLLLIKLELKLKINDILQNNFKIIITIVKKGIPFLSINILQALILGMDYIIISIYLNNYESIEYGIVYRIFGFLALIYVAMYNVLWPDYTKYFLAKNFIKINKSVIEILTISWILIIGFSTLFYISSDLIVQLIAPNKGIKIDGQLIFMMCIYHLIICWVHGYGIILQSIGDTKTIFNWMLIQAIISVPLQVIFIKIFGLVGVIFGISLSFMLTLSWALPMKVKKHFAI